MFNIDTVSTFPTTKASSVNKLITENSLTRLINRLIDLDGYVITNGINSFSETNSTIPLSTWSNNPFEFVIHGYYFNIPDVNTLIEGWKNSTSDNTIQGNSTLYAKIFVDTTVSDYPELWGQYVTENVKQTFTNFDLGTSKVSTQYLGHIEGSPVLVDSSNVAVTLTGTVTINEDTGIISVTDDGWVSGKTESDVVGIIFTYQKGYRGVFFYSLTGETGLTENNTTIPEELQSLEDTSTLENGYVSYTIPLIYYGNGDITQLSNFSVFMSNLNKFTSKSIATIDGGII